MNTIPEVTFDITGAAPSADTLANWRRQATEAKGWGSRIYVVLKNRLSVSLILLLGICLTAWLHPAFSLGHVLLGFLCALAGVGLGSLSAASLDLITDFGEIATGMIVFSISGLIGLLVPFFSIETLTSLVFLLLGTTGSMLAGLSFSLESVRYKADHLLENLCELNADEHESACIEYDKLRLNPEVERYHQSIKAQGRKPVHGEYISAKIWVGNAKMRESEAARREEALAACERMSGN